MMGKYLQFYYFVNFSLQAFSKILTEQFDQHFIFYELSHELELVETISILFLNI